MRRIVVISMFVVLFTLAASAVFSAGWRKSGEAGTMVLKSSEFVTSKRPAVKFDHIMHEEQINCQVCHHDFKVFQDHNNGKGSKCESCHTLEGADDIPVPLRLAFHKNCRGCHQKWHMWGRKSGPFTCAGCHKEG